MKEDAATLAEMADQRTPRQKSAAALLPKVIKMLAKSQMEAYKSREDVEIPVSSLPAGLQKTAMDYINMTVAERDKMAGFPPPDPTKGFSLVLRITNLVIGINAFAYDGTLLAF